MPNKPVPLYKPRLLSVEHHARLIELANLARASSGPALEAVKGDLEDLMERLWINRHDASGVTWWCKVWIDDLDTVLAWARSHGFRLPADRRRIRDRLIHFIEDRLRDGEPVPTDGVTLRSEIRIHAGGLRPVVLQSMVG